MKSEITQAEYQMLWGLLGMAKLHARRINECRDTICQLLAIGEVGTAAGLCRDEVDEQIRGSDEAAPDRLLKRLSITVRPMGQPQEVGK